MLLIDHTGTFTSLQIELHPHAAPAFFERHPSGEVVIGLWQVTVITKSPKRLTGKALFRKPFLIAAVLLTAFAATASIKSPSLSIELAGPQ